MDWNTFISFEVTMSPRWGNMDDGSKCFFYQFDLLYGTEPNDTGLRNDNADDVGGDDTNKQPQPSYLDFSSYFMPDEVYYITFICLCFVNPCVLLLNHFFDSFRFFKSTMIC